MSGVNEVHIKRRVFAHQNNVMLGQWCIAGLLSLKPVLVVVKHLDRPTLRGSSSFIQKQVVLLHVIDLPIARACCEHHCKSGIFIGADALDGVHHDADGNTHNK